MPGVAAAVAVAAHHEHHHQRARENEKQKENGRGVQLGLPSNGCVGAVRCSLFQARGRCASRTAMKMTAPRTTSQNPIIKVVQSQSQPLTQVCMAPLLSLDAE